MRTSAFTAIVPTTLAAAVLGTAGFALNAAPAQATESVDAEKVVLAAQLDPAKSDTGTTACAAESVEIVEQALADEGLLDAARVDGHFGSDTVEAYSDWQEEQGASGEGANGLPGSSTLTALGEDGGFTVTNPIDLGGRTTVDGKTLNQRTADMLAEAEERSGIDLRVTQGSYNPGGVAASGGTHDGGGAVDIATRDLSSSEREAAVTAMREVGFAAWDRTGVKNFDPHIHAVAISDTDLASAAWKADANRQVYDYYTGKDGLADHGADCGPDVEPVTWEDYQRSN